MHSYPLVDWLADDLIVRHLLHSPNLTTDYLIPRYLTPSGAVGVNAAWERKEAPVFFIEQQRLGTEFIQAAGVGGRPEALAIGLGILEWGLARQGPQGDFPGCRDQFHSMEIFLEAFCRAALVLSETQAGTWAGLKDRWTAAAQRCGEWMIDPKNLQAGLEINEPFVHRLWILAAALASAGAITNDARFNDVAGDLVGEAVQKQQANGINPERDGFDISYQSAGLLMAARFYAATSDAPSREATRAMLERGLAFVLTKEGEKGRLSLEGSTRVGVEKHRTGVRKGVNYWELLQASVFTARITDRKDFFSFARRLAEHPDGIRLDELL